MPERYVVTPAADRPFPESGVAREPTEILTDVSGNRASIPVTYAHLTGSTTEVTARAYTDVFVNDEPTTYWHHIHPDIFLSFARHYCQLCADLGESIIATDPRTGDCAGFVLCWDLVTDFSRLSEDMAAFTACFPDTVAIIDALEFAFLERDHIVPGDTLHIFQVGVRREYRNQGIATALISHILLFAQTRGFSHVVAECTGPVSRHTFEQCGFVECGHIPYDQFRHNDRVFFAGLPGGISLVVLEL